MVQVNLNDYAFLDSISGKGGWYVEASTGDVVLIIAGEIAARFTVSVSDYVATFDQVSSVVASRTRKIRLPLNSWVLDGSAPPTAGVAGVFPALGFATAADDIIRNSLEVPSDWDGASDLALKLRWTNTAATAIAQTETVAWRCDWRSKAAGELYDAGTAGTATTTYTEADDPGIDKEIIETSITIDYDDGDQPLTAGDDLALELRRDVSEDNYGADAHIIDAWIEYQSAVLAGE